MKGIIEFFLAVIVLTVTALAGTSYITAAINTSNARDYHAAVINEIEASNFNRDVIDSLYEDAKLKGYVLEPVEITEIERHKKIAEVILKYKYDIGILNIAGEQHSIRGYAR